MPSLLDLTTQGDVGTIADESKLASLTLMDPQQLYELWERQNWQSHTIDLTQDVRDWAAMDDQLRRQLAVHHRRPVFEAFDRQDYAAVEECLARFEQAVAEAAAQAQGDVTPGDPRAL